MVGFFSSYDDFEIFKLECAKNERYFSDFILLWLQEWVVLFRAQGNATVNHKMKVIINGAVSGPYHIFREEECLQFQVYTVTEN